MGRKIFVSYKYADSSVPDLNLGEQTTVRHYVDIIQGLLSEEDHINKGENDGEDLSSFKESTIESKLRDKIFDSTITIVLISKNMKDPSKNESDQWIPWEVSYSLKEITRGDKTSGTNAMLAVVLPDEKNDYSYFVNHFACTTSWNTDILFKILGNNMFNRNNKNLISCQTCGGTHHIDDDHSYIHPVKWCDFIKDINKYIDIALKMNNNLNEYKIQKEL